MTKKAISAIQLIAVVLFISAYANAQQPYFQQEVKYTVHVSLDDKEHMLNGNWELEYTNHSPVTLDSIYMHLWPNAYGNRKTEFAKQQMESNALNFYYSKDSSKGFIDRLDFTSNGNALKWNQLKGKADIAIVHLDKPLGPGEKVNLRTPFRVKIPSDFSRMGHVGQQYQITQWIPKPAVFDRDGWHPISYLDQGEFYSEYGSFEVYITVPKNYVVGATGDLPSGDPELAWLQKREKMSREMLDKSAPDDVFEMEFSETEMKTLHFSQRNVHDFAWFCDKQYYVLTDSIALPASGRKVQCVAMFPARVKKIWADGPAMVGRGVYHYSKYNGDYPYNHCTAVEGALSAGGGMEYPNITVVSAGGDALSLENVIVHEVGHNWYYGILGSNERLHPWMDEGINTFFENRFMVEQHGNGNAVIPEKIAKLLGVNVTHDFLMKEAYNVTAGSNQDQPIELSSEKYTGGNYGMIVYMKTGYAFKYLEEFLGRETIDNCFHAYYEKWKFKHPQPADIQAVFEETSGKDLDWFFGDFIQTNQKLDFRIKKIDGNVVTVQNLSHVKAPVSVTLLNEEGNPVEMFWSEPFTGETTFNIGSAEFKRIQLNENAVAPEVRQENNGMRATGLFKRCKPWTFSFGYKYTDPKKTQFNWAPIIGYNTTDGFMAGLALYHHVFPKKRFEFHLMPMYAFRSQSVTGLAGGTYRIFTQKVFEKISITSRTALFADQLRTHNRIEFELREKNLRNPLNQVIGFHAYHLSLRNTDGFNLANYYKPIYGCVKWNLSTPFRIQSIRAAVELGGNVTEQIYRGSAVFQYDRKITRKMKAGVRFFGGLIMGSGYAPWLLSYRPDGSGDPFGQMYLADRGSRTAWLSHQLTNDHGAMNSMTGGSFNRSLVAANFYFQPIKLISVFGDVAAGHSETDFGPHSETLYDAGLSINIIRNAFRFNFPLVGSVYNNGIPENMKDIWQNVNFNLDLLGLTRSISIPGLN